MIRILALLAILAGPAVGDATAQTPPSEPIGVATMNAEGIVTLRLRAAGPGGAVGEGTLTYGPNDAEYRSVLRHLGGLRPGESKPVLPWPDEMPEPRSRRR